jgi:hypothetical protein
MPYSSDRARRFGICISAESKIELTASVGFSLDVLVISEVGGNIVTCRGLRVTYRHVLDWMIGLIDTFIHSYSSGLQAIQRYRLSAQFTFHRYTRTKILRLH